LKSIDTRPSRDSDARAPVLIDVEAVDFNIGRDHAGERVNRAVKPERRRDEVNVPRRD